MSPLIDLIGSAKGYGWGGLLPTGDFESISTVTVGAGGLSTITFSSIPSTYTHLQIRCYDKDDRGFAGSASSLRFNSDSGANYSDHGLVGDGTSIVSYATTSGTSAGLGNTAGGLNSNIYGIQLVDILDYADTNKNKTIRTLGGADQNGFGFSGLFSGSWRSTSAVNSITLYPLATLFNQYSSFALYGIK